MDNAREIVESGQPWLLTMEQAALYLNIPKATLYTWRTRKKDQAPRAVKVGGVLRFRRSDLDLWIESHLEALEEA